jgi:hypothetical protein
MPSLAVLLCRGDRPKENRSGDKNEDGHAEPE